MNKKLEKLIDLKSIVTLLMTLAMVLLLTGVFNPSREAFALFATSYGAIITYFFTKKSKKDGETDV